MKELLLMLGLSLSFFTSYDNGAELDTPARGAPRKGRPVRTRGGTNRSRRLQVLHRRAEPINGHEFHPKLVSPLPSVPFNV